SHFHLPIHYFRLDLGEWRDKTPCVTQRVRPDSPSERVLPFFFWCHSRRSQASRSPATGMGFWRFPDLRSDWYFTSVKQATHYRLPLTVPIRMHMVFL